MMRWSKFIKQLNRQIDVIRIRDIYRQAPFGARGNLVKMSAPAEKRAEILAIIQPFRATVVDVAPSSITIQMTGNAEKSEALLRVIRPYGIAILLELVQTGFTAINTFESLQITSALPAVLGTAGG